MSTTSAPPAARSFTALNHKIGHLALFVSSKVGAKEDEEFVQLMDVIDCLPPGLYEMVIAPRPAEEPRVASLPATGRRVSRPARSTTFARLGATAPQTTAPSPPRRGSRS